MQANVVGQDDRTGQEGAFGDDHDSATGRRGGINGLLDRYRTENLAPLLCAMVRNQEFFEIFSRWRLVDIFRDSFKGF